MSRKLMSENEVKELLKIDDFRNMSKNKIVEFVSMIPKMDKEVALASINKFPNYAVMAKEMITELAKTLDNAIKNATDANKETLKGYMSILEGLKEELKRDDCSLEERQKINEQMMEIANKIFVTHSEHTSLVGNIVQTTGKVVFGAIVVAGAILGVNAFNKKK